MQGRYTVSPAKQRGYEGTPGPGAYKVGGERAVEGPKYVFGSSERSRGKSPGDGTPGPGSYKIPSKIADLPPFAMPNQKDEFRYI